jgi:hypothetical protein
MRPPVQRAPGLPCALYFLGRANLQDSDISCREKVEVYPPVMPAQAGIQYSEVSVMESRARGVLDTRRSQSSGAHSRDPVAGMTLCLLFEIESAVIPAQLFPRHLEGNDALLRRRAMRHHPTLPRIAHQCDVAIDAVHEFAVRHGDEQREYHAEM